MNRSIFLVVLFFFVLNIDTSAQFGRPKEGIKIEKDQFTKQTRKKTNYVKLAWSMKGSIQAYIRSVDTLHYLVTFNGGSAVGVIGTNDALIFLFTDDSQIKIYPTSIQDYDISVNGNTAMHQYYLTIEQVRQLAEKDIKAIRKYLSDGYTDLEVDKKRQGNLREVAKLFL